MRFLFKGITLASVYFNSDGTADPTALLITERTVPELFGEQEVSWGNFGALVGSCGADEWREVKGKGAFVDTCIYPVAIGARGLMFARAEVGKIADKDSVSAPRNVP